MVWKSLLVFCLTSTFLGAQTDAAFIKKDTNIWTAMAPPFQIEVNGVEIPFTGDLIKTRINERGFDTIVFQNARFRKVSIMKLRPGNTYLIHDNTCSFYTLQPTQGSKRGVVKFKVDKGENKLYRVGNDITRVYHANKRDKYYYYPHSAMCVDAAQRLRLESETGDELSSVNFHFLHGEKLFYVFNEETGNIDLRLMGLVKKEKEYRVRHDKH